MENLQRIGIAALVVVGSVAGFTASGIAGAYHDGYFLGRERKKGVTYKKIAKRNAVLGGVVGAVSAAVFLSSSSHMLSGHRQNMRRMPNAVY
tara:strand:+ start:169 stop:444 length:276 start_codon:yes stop_codon:yes gene_type:complete